MFSVIGNTDTHILLGVSFVWLFTDALFENNKIGVLPTHPIKGLKQILGVAQLPLGTTRTTASGCTGCVLHNSRVPFTLWSMWIAPLKVVEGMTWAQ